MDKLVESGVNLRKAVAMGMADEDMRPGGDMARPARMKPAAGMQQSDKPADGPAPFTKQLY